MNYRLSDTWLSAAIYRWVLRALTFSCTQAPCWLHSACRHRQNKGPGRIHDLRKEEARKIDGLGDESSQPGPWMKLCRRSNEQVQQKLKYFSIWPYFWHLWTQDKLGGAKGVYWSAVLQSIGQKWGPKPVSPSFPLSPPEGRYSLRTLWCSRVIRVECSLSMYLIASSMMASYRHHTHALHVKTRLTTSNVFHIVRIS